MNYQQKILKKPFSLSRMVMIFSIPAIDTVLMRLEDKGLLKSKMGEASPERGGRRKRLYEATRYGVNVFQEIKKERLRLWSKIPAFKLK